MRVIEIELGPKHGKVQRAYQIDAGLKRMEIQPQPGKKKEGIRIES